MKYLFKFILVLTFLSFLSCKKGKNNPESCNGKNTRREIKIAIDASASQIDTIPIITSVSEIGSLSVPEADKESQRQSVEKRVYQITAKVNKVSKHFDGDWKVKLTDGNDKYVNCESPNMGCTYIKDSRFFDEMESVRDWIEVHKDELCGKTVTITGVGFIDIDHRFPRNAAVNEMELHPILDIHY